MSKGAELQEARAKMSQYKTLILRYSIGINPKTQEGWEELGDAMMSLGYFIRTYADKLHAQEGSKTK